MSESSHCLSVLISAGISALRSSRYQVPLHNTRRNSRTDLQAPTGNLKCESLNVNTAFRAFLYHLILVCSSTNCAPPSHPLPHVLNRFRISSLKIGLTKGMLCFNCYILLFTMVLMQLTPQVCKSMLLILQPVTSTIILAFPHSSLPSPLSLSVSYSVSPCLLLCVFFCVYMCVYLLGAHTHACALM